jgi:hypothetical protein
MGGFKSLILFTSSFDPTLTPAAPADYIGESIILEH